MLCRHAKAATTLMTCVRLGQLLCNDCSVYILMIIMTAWLDDLAMSFCKMQLPVQCLPELSFCNKCCYLDRAL